MAKPSWLSVSPASGSGSRSVTVSTAAEHTGRLPRKGVLTFKAANCPNVTRNVIQAGKPEFADIAESASAPKEGKTVTIAGVSNSKILTFSLGTGELQVKLPGQYKANSVNTDNGAEISGDPGAAATYNFSIAIVVPANGEITEQTRQIIVTDEGGHQDVCLLTLAAGDAYLTVTEGDINLTYQGTGVEVAISSNTSWTVE